MSTSSLTSYNSCWAGRYGTKGFPSHFYFPRCSSSCINDMHLWLVGSGAKARSKGQRAGPPGFRTDIIPVSMTLHSSHAAQGRICIRGLRPQGKLCRCSGSVSGKLDFKETGMLTRLNYRKSCLCSHCPGWDGETLPGPQSDSGQP